MPETSLAPDGRAYRVPTPVESADALPELRRRAESARSAGAQVVVVQGLGMVGAAVAAVVADASLVDGSPAHFVIGLDLARPTSFWKVARLNEGSTPIRSPDPSLEPITRRAVRERRNLVATTCEAALALADVVLVDVALDVGPAGPDLAGFESALRSVGRWMRPDALVLIETTVPLGASRRLARPALTEERVRRGCYAPLRLAHAYERVTPGARYVESIRSAARTVAADDPASLAAARDFLGRFVDLERHPLRELASADASELAKLLENAYRAVNIAFVHEWTLLAEAAGVDLFAVVDSIRVRRGTHDNMRLPGFGVGGYCLPKDPLLAQWSAETWFPEVPPLELSLRALTINREMPLHALRLLRELAGGELRGRTVAICGVAYLPDVDDTRNSPSRLLCEELAKCGARVRVHDPVVRRWEEQPDIEVERDLDACLQGADGVVLAVPHQSYRKRSVRDWLEAASDCSWVVDAQDVLDDLAAEALALRGVRLAGVGKGHWCRLPQPLDCER